VPRYAVRNDNLGAREPVTLTEIGTSAWCATLNVVEVGFDDEPEAFPISTRAKSCRPGKACRRTEPGMEGRVLCLRFPPTGEPALAYPGLLARYPVVEEPRSATR